MGMDTRGREYLSLVVKGTYDISDGSGAAHVAAEQRPLVMADEFTGEPGRSAPLWESDFAFRKSRCDVVAQGAAYAPNGRPVERVRVGLRVGDWVKQFDVVGARHWRVFDGVVSRTRPLPFTKVAFSYDTAFGGVDGSAPEADPPPAYKDNPVGLGYADAFSESWLNGRPVANTEAVGDEIVSPFERYRPMALGPIGRAWPERRRYAGTYDQSWIDTVFPFLPADFDERYYQTAPQDQQVDPPAPGTPVVVVGMTPSGRAEFRLPETRLPVRVHRKREIAFNDRVLPDTLIFDCEAGVLMSVWRIWIPIRRQISEFSEAWVGTPTAQMLRAWRSGRIYVREAKTEAETPEEVV